MSSRDFTFPTKYHTTSYTYFTHTLAKLRRNLHVQTPKYPKPNPSFFEQSSLPTVHQYYPFPQCTEPSGKNSSKKNHQTWPSRSEEGINRVEFETCDSSTSFPSRSRRIFFYDTRVNTTALICDDCLAFFQEHRVSPATKYAYWNESFIIAEVEKRSPAEMKCSESKVNEAIRLRDWRSKSVVRYITVF